MRIAETERLIFREFELTDAEDLHCICSDAETMKYLGGIAVSAADERVWIQKHIENYYKNTVSDFGRRF